MSNFIEELEKELEEKQIFLNKLKDIKKNYPSLDEYRGRWRTVYCSKEINGKTDEVQIEKSCGCCVDAALLAKPFKEIEGIKIFSDPVKFTIGWGEYSGGYTLNEGWDEKMKKALIPEKIITKVKEYIDDHNYLMKMMTEYF